jgi:hypothetical protein
MCCPATGSSRSGCVNAREASFCGRQAQPDKIEAALISAASIQQVVFLALRSRQLFAGFPFIAMKEVLFLPEPELEKSFEGGDAALDQAKDGLDHRDGSREGKTFFWARLQS